MPIPYRLATALCAAVVLAGCGVAPAAVAPTRAAAQLAARDFDRMELAFSYRLGSKAAKAFMAEAEKLVAPYKERGTTCELKADGGLFGTKIQVKLAGRMAQVVPLREALDALHASHK